MPNLHGVKFTCCEYILLDIPENSIIYCDPPYQNTDKTFKEKQFNHDKFWQWCRDMAVKGHTVFISEYNAPEDFECIWRMEVPNTHPNQKKKATECLFKYKPL